MIRGITLLLFGTLVLASGCNGTHVRWRPSLADQVPNGTPVRFTEPGANYMLTSLWYGRAVGWNTATPRIVTARGDTMTVPLGARLEVLLPEKKRRTNLGAVLGYLVGIAGPISDCGFERGCGEEDPRPVLGLMLGTMIGSLVRTDEWVTVHPAR